MKNTSILLNTCCAPCATIAIEKLSVDNNVTLHFWGSNIHPQQEYKKRLEAIRALDSNAIIAKYDPIQPESCTQCFETRLRATAEYAKEFGFDIFATTLTTSPHKPAELINQIGEKVAAEYGVKYLPTNFKKNNGFTRSVMLSKQLGLYRQNYCGCTRSLSKKT